VRDSRPECAGGGEGLRKRDRISQQLQRLSERCAGPRQQTARRDLIERKSITLEAETLRKGLANAKRRGFGKSFSAYIAWLIERDASGDVQREEPRPRVLKYGEPLTMLAEEGEHTLELRPVDPTKSPHGDS
jgi:hypothetical protein